MGWLSQQRTGWHTHFQESTVACDDLRGFRSALPSFSREKRRRNAASSLLASQGVAQSRLTPSKLGGERWDSA